MASGKDVLKTISDKGVKFVDFRFCDTKGKEQHVTVPAKTVDEAVFTDGKMFDGSSIAGWKGIDESDMILMPDSGSAVLDPFAEESTLILRCDVIEPSTMQGYGRDPRSLAHRAEAFLKSTGIADAAYFGPELEFFVFDSVRWDSGMWGSYVHIDSEEAPWNTGKEYEGGNMGHRPPVKGGYFPVPPVDSLQDIRNAMCLTLEEMGIPVEVHHHEVAAPGQCEIGTRFNTLVRKGDEMLIYKYVLQNVAHSFGKTVTFMPKPVVGDNGTGMHVHQSLAKDGKNLFTGDKYGGLSETALYYIGGILKHAKAINAFTNSTTNSYKRLVPGYEAPINLVYSQRNRSAAIRIPMYSKAEGAKRIEFRTPDPTCNPYLSFAACVMAGLDGVANKIDPGKPVDKDIYELSGAEKAKIKSVPGSLAEALDALESDHKFLLEGGVFTKDVIDTWIEYKRKREVDAVALRPHPWEFMLYSDV